MFSEPGFAFYSSSKTHPSPGTQLQPIGQALVFLADNEPPSFQNRMHPTSTARFIVPPTSSPTHRSRAEKELIANLRLGHQQAFGQLYDRYGAVLYGIVFKIIKEQTVAEDVLQEAFVKIWLNFPSYDEHKGSLFTWLLNITRNQAIDKISSQAFRQRVLTQPLEQAAEVSSWPAEWLGIEGLLPGLKDQEKRLIDLIYYQGYSGPEVAGQLGIPLGTVKTRLRAAVTKLRKWL